MRELAPAFAEASLLATVGSSIRWPIFLWYPRRLFEHIDALNLFNRIEIYNPRTNVNDPATFGRVFEKCGGGARQIQLGARANF